MLHIGTWLWGSKYPLCYVGRLKAGVAKHLEQPHQWHVWSPDKEDDHLTLIPGCLCRLRMFSPEWQHLHGINEGDRLVCLDLDTVITGPLDDVFERQEPFVIMQGYNAANPCPYLGAMMMLQAGAYPEIWSTFSYEKVNLVAVHEFPDDQGWLADRLPNAAAWTVADGVYAFAKPGWPRGQDLPADARIVTFPGHRDPSQFTHIPWVRKHWIGSD